MSIGGYLRSSKLLAKLYFKLVLKNKFSLKISSLSFSSKTAPLKNSSLDAMKGLSLIPVDVLNLLVVCLSYIVFAFLLNVSSISDTAFKFAISKSVLMFFSIPDFFDASAIISSIISKLG